MLPWILNRKNCSKVLCCKLDEGRRADVNHILFRWGIRLEKMLGQYFLKGVPDSCKVVIKVSP